VPRDVRPYVDQVLFGSCGTPQAWLASAHALLLPERRRASFLIA
jgi:hypothetical protein